MDALADAEAKLRKLQNSELPAAARADLEAVQRASEEMRKSLENVVESAPDAEPEDLKEALQHVDVKTARVLAGGELKSYRHPAGAYELSYPARWSAERTSDGLSITDPSGEAQVLVTEPAKGSDPEALLRGHLQKVRAAWGNLRRTSQSHRWVAGQRARVEGYRGGERGALRQGEAVVLVSGSSGFVISRQAPTESFPATEAAWGAILTTFRFTASKVIAPRSIRPVVRREFQP